MDYSRPTYADRLAAEYVLGTLQGHARRRFEALLPSHPALQRAVAGWQDRLIPLSASVPGVQPGPAVWEQVQERLFGMQKRGPTSVVATPRRSQRVDTWRHATAASLLLAFALSVPLWWPLPPRAPILVVLSPTSGGPASFVAAVAPDGRSLVLAPIGGLTVDPTQVLELWLLPKQGAPRSLGLVSAHRPSKVLRSHLLDGASALALSIEAPGGAPKGMPSALVSMGKLPG